MGHTGTGPIGTSNGPDWNGEDCEEADPRIEIEVLTNRLKNYELDHLRWEWLVNHTEDVLKEYDGGLCELSFEQVVDRQRKKKKPSKKELSR